MFPSSSSLGTSFAEEGDVNIALNTCGKIEDKTQTGKSAYLDEERTLQVT